LLRRIVPELPGPVCGRWGPGLERGRVLAAHRPPGTGSAEPGV